MARSPYPNMPHMFLAWNEMNHALQDVMHYAYTLDEVESPGIVVTLGTVYERIARVMDFITERSCEMGTYEDESHHKHPIPFTEYEFGVLVSALKHDSGDAVGRLGWPSSLTTKFYAKVDVARKLFPTPFTHEEA